MNYIEEAYNNIFENESLLYESLLDHLDVEADFINACIENNIILEAGAPNIKEKMSSFVNKVKEFLKKIFDSFKQKGIDLYKVNEKWIKANINKVDSIDYNGLNAEVIPFWNMSTDDINKILDELSLAIKNIPSPSELEKLKDKTAIENSEPFAKYTKNGDSFKDGLQKWFMVGGGKKLEPVKLEDGNLESRCQTTFRDYIQEYNSGIIPKLQAKINKMNQNMDSVTRLVTAGNVTESFCLLEDCMFKDTELRYLSNFPVLEAEGEAQNNAQQKQDDKPNVREVEITDDNKPEKDSNGNQTGGDLDLKDKSKAQLTYIQNVVSLNQIALATAMTVYETKFSVYLKVIKSVVGARGKKETKETENKEEK